MAKPRVFISSTFYDLRQIRADIDQFLRGLGYDAIRNEEGSIPYGKEDRLEDYCIQEVRHQRTNRLSKNIFRQGLSVKENLEPHWKTKNKFISL